MDEIVPVSLPPLSIRSMQPGDLNRVVAIADSLPAAPQWPRQAYLHALDPESRPARIAIVAEAGQTVLGFVLISLIPPEAELESIAVASEAQRQGLGRLLLEAAIAAVRATGIRVLLLEIRTSNAPAAALYRHIGFRETGRRTRYYSHPTEDAILMELNLL